MSKFTIYIREPVTKTRKNWFREVSKTYNDQVQHVVYGERYSILEHDSGVRRLIIKNEDGSHVFTCRWQDLSSIYINGIKEDAR